MPLKLKPLADQAIVITGASSGHGLCTARMAAAKGAKVMLAAREGETLAEICEDIRARGGTAEFLVTDVSSLPQVDCLAIETIDRFGRFDTWINNAAVGLYGDLLTIPMDEHRRLFETNYWGLVYGSIAAVRHFQARPGGGALINVGSVNGDMPTPVLGAYNASKHAVKGFTNSLRIEMIRKKAPVSVTLIKPSATGTPFPQHAANRSGYEARLPRPMYSPEPVAKAILYAAEHKRRSITVGGTGKFQVLGATILPWLFDRVAAAMEPALLDKTDPAPSTQGNLRKTHSRDGQVEGRQHGRGFSLFTAAGRHRWTAFGIVAAFAAAGAGALVSRERL